MAHTTDKQVLAMLKDVSRSFYLTLRVLPRTVRLQIGLAYLLARTSDTIADTDLVPLDQRLQALKAFRLHFSGQKNALLDLAELAGHQASAAERILLEKCSTILGFFDALESLDAQMVRDVLATITSGQELDLVRFAGASAENIAALQTDVELDDYTYRVAGCVGEFWTRICRRHIFPRDPLNEQALLAEGVRFGKGLQLVNILRDFASDIRLGRCYLPAQKLSAAGLAPKDLIMAANEPRLRPLYNEYLAIAEGHLLAGWHYTNALPRRSVRVRLACAWPILIGMETLRRLRANPVLDAARRVKVSRSQVKKFMVRSIILYPLPNAWEGMVRV